MLPSAPSLHATSLRSDGGRPAGERQDGSLTGPDPAWGHHSSPAQRLSDVTTAGPGRTVAEQVMAAELTARTETSPALALMVGSMGRMVQAGRDSGSRWSAR